MRCCFAERHQGEASSFQREERQHPSPLLTPWSHHLAAPCGLGPGGLCGRGTSAASDGAMGTWGTMAKLHRPLLGRSPGAARSPRSQTPSETLQTPTCAKENSPSVLILAKTNSGTAGGGTRQPLRERRASPLALRSFHFPWPSPPWTPHAQSSLCRCLQLCPGGSIPAWGGTYTPPGASSASFPCPLSISSTHRATQHPDCQQGEALLGWESAERRRSQRGRATGDAAAPAAQRASWGLARVLSSPSQPNFLIGFFFF